MISIEAAYYDGRSSARRGVRVDFDADGQVRIRGDGIALDLDYPALRISSRLGSTPRYLYLPGGGRLETSDNDGVDRVVGALGGHEVKRFLSFLESRYSIALAALVITVGVVFATIEYGIPLLARQVAFAMPNNIEASLGREGLGALDQGMFAPSQLDPRAQARAHELFTGLRHNLPVKVDARLELRASERLGANAFALPAGYVVITDDLVKLTRSEEELTAVMAHEIGHVQHRHILRQILQNSLTALLVAGLFGDLTSIAGLSATLPTFIVQQKYSRQFELEADGFATSYLRSQNLPVAHLANILKRLTEQQPGPGGGMLDYLASHPATDERIDALLEEQVRE